MAGGRAECHLLFLIKKAYTLLQTFSRFIQLQ